VRPLRPTKILGEHLTWGLLCLEARDNITYALGHFLPRY